MAVVQAQPVFGSPYEPGREAMRAIEFGQGLRARQDAMQRQTAEYNREQQVRELLGSGRPEEAKKLMTLQERGQLVNIQGAMLNQKIAGLELDMKEKALNDAYGFIDRASKLNPNTDAFEQEAQSLVTEAAPIAGLNPQIASALGSTIEAKANERKTLLRKVSDEYMRDFNAVIAEDIPFAEKSAKVNQWVADNPEALHGPFGKRIEDAKNDFIREARSQSLIEASGRTSERNTEFERTLVALVDKGTLSQEEADALRLKRAETYATPRLDNNPYAAAIAALIGDEPAAPVAAPATAGQKFTREQLIEAVRTGKLSKEEAKRIAQEQGIQ